MRILLRSILSVLFTICALSSYSQEVRDVRAVQNGEKIEIYYKIANAKPDQIFTVTAYFENAKGLRTPLVHVLGDAGPNVVGGKAVYMMTWDVLKDVDQLGEAEFIIKIEKQEKKVQVVPHGPTWFLAYNGAVSYTPYGFRLGYGKRWGAWAAARFGSGGFAQSGNEITDKMLYSFTAGISRELIGSKSFSMQAYVGGGSAQWGNYSVSNTITVSGNADNQFQPQEITKVAAGNIDDGLEIEYGLNYVSSRVHAGVGMATNLGFSDTHHDLVISVGLRF